MYFVCVCTNRILINRYICFPQFCKNIAIRSAFFLWAKSIDEAENDGGAHGEGEEDQARPPQPGLPLVLSQVPQDDDAHQEADRRPGQVRHVRHVVLKDNTSTSLMLSFILQASPWMIVLYALVV